MTYRMHPLTWAIGLALYSPDRGAVMPWSTP